MSMPSTAVAASLNRAARRKLEELYRARLTYKRNDLHGDIQTYSDLVRKKAEELTKVEDEVGREVARFAEVTRKLKAARIKFCNPWGLRVDVTTTRKGLVKVYKAIGRLDGSKASKSIHDAEKGEVEVTLPSALYPDVVVTYVHKLGKGDRCRIETVQETRTRLVCARD
jgi:hypothetical protein